MATKRRRLDDGEVVPGVAQGEAATKDAAEQGAAAASSVLPASARGRKAGTGPNAEKVEQTKLAAEKFLRAAMEGVGDAAGTAGGAGGASSGG